MGSQSRTDQLNAEITDGVFQLVGRIIGQGEKLAQRLGIPTFFIKALHMLDCPMAMKDLGKRIGCDASFVTVIADTLEQRGLARREAHTADRRIKNLVLTGDGQALRERLEREMTARMPWVDALTDDERGQLLTLIRKMLHTESDPSDEPATTSAVPEPPDNASPTSQAPAGEVPDRLSTGVPSS